MLVIKIITLTGAGCNSVFVISQAPSQKLYVLSFLLLKLLFAIDTTVFSISQKMTLRDREGNALDQNQPASHRWCRKVRCFSSSLHCLLGALLVATEALGLACPASLQVDCTVHPDASRVRCLNLEVGEGRGLELVFPVLCHACYLSEPAAKLG